MTTNKPEVKRYFVDCSLMYFDDIARDECDTQVVLASYYDELLAECSRLKLEVTACQMTLSDERGRHMAECEKLRKDAERYVPLNEAVQRAATELPEGWEIQLCVMRDSGWVDLIGPDGTEDFDTDNERLDCTVIDALEFAIDAAMQGGKP